MWILSLPSPTSTSVFVKKPVEKRILLMSSIPTVVGQKKSEGLFNSRVYLKCLLLQILKVDEIAV